MLMLINTLVGIFAVLSLSICLIFKNVFAYLMAFTMLCTVLIGARAEIKNNTYSISTILSLIWLILCEVIVFGFKFIRHTNVFEKFGDNTFKFVITGLFVLLVPYIIKAIIPKCNNKTN